MLAGLTISNVVLIEKLNTEFQAGFCALTGETGAGKSILLDSLGLALGVRAEAGLIRKGAEQAAVSAEFHVDKNHPVLALLKEQGLEVDETLVLRRVLGADGRSRAFINDQPVSVTLLRQAGALLVEIHGQFETQGLLDAATHRAILDDYAGLDAKELTGLWDKWRAAETALREAQENAKRAKAEEDYLRAAVDDLDELSPKPGEEEKLAGLRSRLMRREQSLEALNAAHEGLNETESALNAVWKALEKAGEDAKKLLEGLDRATVEIREVSSQVQGLSSDLEDNEYSLPEIDDRLFALRGQARKHGCAPDELTRVRDELAARLLLAERQEEVLDGLKDNVAKARAAYIAGSEKVGAARRKAAEKLDKLVAKELPPLKLDKARFVTEVNKLDESQWGPAGFDSVRFLVATNPGSAPGPLDKIASGGEMARFMLALKVIMAEVGTACTLVFDEVDSGIGGSTAAAVGERLARLARSRQILVVTHSPQVAAKAAHHWIVAKDGRKDVTTRVLALNDNRLRREEIARMLSGASVTDEARAAADRLLETGT